MFFDGNLFWFLMGLLFVVVAFGFKFFAEDRGWQLTWWKSGLGVIWYAIFALTFYAAGTLMGENETNAGIKMLLFGLFVSVILGVGLWRLLVLNPKKA